MDTLNEKTVPIRDGVLEFPLSSLEWKLIQVVDG
jgi:hypothetical protein